MNKRIKCQRYCSVLTLREVLWCQEGMWMMRITEVARADEREADTYYFFGRLYNEE